MLRELHISNLAVIEDATVELTDGLNVFTGQTGAGKSLLIGAFELLLGLRSGGSDAGEMIRAKAEEARVVGLFELSDEQTAERLSEIFDRPIPADEPLLITRRLFTSGRSSVSVNGEPATAAMLRQAGEFLVDIHGQTDQQTLLRPSHQLRILDDFAGARELRSRFAACYEARRTLRRRREELTGSQGQRRQQMELWEFQLAEIDQAELTAGEFEQVQSRYRRLSNIGHITSQASNILDGLAEQDDSILDRLGVLNKHFETLAKLDDEPLGPIAAQAAEAAELLRDCSFQLGRYVDGLELDPGELTEAEQRLDTLNHLIHKYAPAKPGQDAVAAVLAWRDQVAAELDAMRHAEADLAEIDQKDQALLAELAEIGSKLSAKRQAAAKKLRPLIEAELGELGMGEAQFQAELTTVAPDSDEAGPAGLDRVEFLVQTNPGQARCPLRRIASGGELSRIMLAVKSILSETDRINVLVFDEIDANIGGRLGSVIGRKMRRLADGQAGRQVLCITHLPQIAAWAGHHLRIVKNVSGSGDGRQTHTTVTPLAGEERLAELAEMLSGKDYTDTALAQARELLAGAS
jgi:DNA repair protein RecN (Recombination protein N)